MPRTSEQQNTMQVVFNEEQAKSLPAGQPYISYVVFSDWTEGHQVMMHQHADIAEILLIVNGHGRYSIGMHRCDIGGGDVILCNCGMLHDEFPESDEVYETICIGIRGLALEKLAPGQLVDESISPIFHQPAQFKELETLGRMILAHVGKKNHTNRMLCQNLMLAMLELVQQMAAGMKPEAVPQDQELIVQVEKYIDTYYARELSIERLSQRFFVSSYHLAHLFKRYTGYTIKQYILRRRIGEAQVRLYETADSVSDIAHAVGFEDAAYFSRLFSKYVGMSPREYREYRVKK